MYHAESFQKMREFVSDNHALKNLLEMLPVNPRIRVLLEDRIPCRLVLNAEGADLLPEDEPNPEWEITLFAESIRLLRKNPPDSVYEWAATLFQHFLAGQLSFQPRLTVKEWWNRGYPHVALKFKDLLKKT